MPTTKSSSDRSPISATVFLPLVFLIGLGVGYLLWGRPGAQAAQATPTAEVRRIDVSVGDAPSIGPQDAPVTIIEFSDYQCPYCKLWHDQVYDELMANYPGKVRFVYRDFPLDGHPEALPAAEAAHCAGEQNAYWEFSDALFGRAYGLSRAAYLRYAGALDLNMDSFTACLDSQRYQSSVTSELEYAYGLGVQSTPTFFINGIPLVGAQSFEDFKKIIDQELAGKKQ